MPPGAHVVHRLGCPSCSAELLASTLTHVEVTARFYADTLKSANNDGGPAFTSISNRPLVRPGGVLHKIHRAPKPKRPLSRPLAFGGDGKAPPPSVKPRRKSQETFEAEFVKDRECEATEEEELPAEERDLYVLERFVGDWVAVHTINRKAFAQASVP